MHEGASIFFVASSFLLHALSLDPPISAMVTANLNNPVMVGQTDNTLTCDISGAEGLTDQTITYQWTRDGETIQSGSSNTFDFSSPLRLSLAGRSVYACSASVGSNLLINNIEASAGTTQTVTIQSELTIQYHSSCHSDIIIILFSHSSTPTVYYSHC